MRVTRNRPAKSESGTATVSGSARPAGVVTIGNFDGVHKGHQALLERCKCERENGEEITVVTFEPAPVVWLAPEFVPARLSGVYAKLACLRDLGVDHVWLMRFDDEVAHMAPEEFVERILTISLNASTLVVGEDFRFGRQREGDVKLLQVLCRARAIALHIVSDVNSGGQRISSSAVRKALANDDFDGAAQMLGRRYTMGSHVVRGQQLGRNLGYPTANLRVTVTPSPLLGIFAAWSRVQGQAWKPAVVSLGRRPTVGGGERLLEVHFFDFKGDLYGQRLEVDFVAKLRSEAHFHDIDDLVIQMVRDESQAREILAQRAVPQ